MSKFGCTHIRKMFCQYGNNVRFADSFVIPGLRETDIQRQMEGVMAIFLS